MRSGRLKFGRVAAVAGLLGAVCAGAAAESPKGEKRMSGPAVRVSLESIHVPPVSQNFLQAGASMMTLNVLDDTHLLVTFATRELVPRLKDDPKDDDDRIVAGEVVELPSGNVLAKTTWHMHDHARYLWPLGQGRFAVRIGSSLSVMAPLANLASGDPFTRVAMPHQTGSVMGVTRSADAEMISVLTQLPDPKGEQVQLGDVDAAKHRYAIDFFRIHGAGTAASPMAIEGAGVVRSNAAFVLPMDADGYLWPTDDVGHGRWDITFNAFGGQQIKAGAIDSSCAPRLIMASRSQYLALACRGVANGDAPRLVAMGLDGYEPWEESFGEFAETPSFVFAPDAGRFAMLVTTTVSVPGSGNLPATESTNQEVRVYQTESGDLLQKVPCSPAFRVPENFDLSESGRTLVVLHEGEILVYTLPELSKKDRQDLAEVEKFRPPVSTGKVVLTRMTEQVREAAGTTNKAQSEQQALAAPTSTTTAVGSGPLPGKQGDIVNGDAGGPRKRPTLLEPGETPEFKDKTAPAP